MNTELNLFIEETLPDEAGYRIVWRANGNQGSDFLDGLNELKSNQSANRLELWNKALTGTHKGFAPFAFRDKNSSKVMVGNTLKMLMGG